VSHPAYPVIRLSEEENGVERQVDGHKLPVRDENELDGEGPAQGRREWVSRGFTWLEDLVYIGLGLLLGGSAVVLLVSGAIRFGQGLLDGTLAANIVDLLDQILLVLMIIEILYTVQVSFREHVLAPEPFLIIVLIAATRRALVLTAEFSRLVQGAEGTFRNAMLELGLLTFMILALAASLLMLRRRSAQAVAKRDSSA
jgi:Phosphate-starvation-inducible E family